MRIFNLIFVATLGIVAALPVVAFSQSKQPASPASQRLFDELVAKDRELFLAEMVGDKNESRGDAPELEGFTVADGAGVDAATKLPTRIIHRASGIRFVLIPAGQFQMGSSEGEVGREKIERQHRRVIKAAVLHRRDRSHRRSVPSFRRRD
jgi:formylglycine-generating enzyme required for sulfatase activity